jgi:hypothetical protein
MAYYTQNYPVSVNSPSPGSAGVIYTLDRFRQQIQLQNFALLFKWQKMKQSVVPTFVRP